MHEGMHHQQNGENLVSPDEAGINCAGCHVRISSYQVPKPIPHDICRPEALGHLAKPRIMFTRHLSRRVWLLLGLQWVVGGYVRLVKG